MKKLLLLFSFSLLVPVLLISSCTKKEDSPSTTAKVTYDANGGKFTSRGSVPTIDTIVKIGGYVPYPAEPTRQNYVFKGWCEDKECKTSWYWLTKVEKDITLYARWEDDGGGGGGGGGKKTLKVELDTITIVGTDAHIFCKVTVPSGTEVVAYGVRYKVEPDGDEMTISMTNTRTQTFEFDVEINGLTAGTTYSYYAFATDSKGTTKVSATKRFTTEEGKSFEDSGAGEKMSAETFEW